MAITVRVTNRFAFSLGHGDEMTFDSTSESHDALMEGSKFVFLRGMQCHGAVMDEAKFEVELGSDCRLRVDFCAGGFEPLHLIGASGDRHENLAFYLVLPDG